jgi:Glutathione S-transferase, N-terminal domain
MKLYVCWGTFQTPRPGGHPCHNAYDALKEAGWDPEVQRTYGWGLLGDALNPTRKPVRELTGQNWVPVLVTDDEVIQGSKEIVEWAKATPASSDRPSSRRASPSG